MRCVFMALVAHWCSGMLHPPLRRRPDDRVQQEQTYEIVYPTRVDRSGGAIVAGGGAKHYRQRRSAAGPPWTENTVYYTLDVLGAEVNFTLTPAQDFIGPSFVVQRMEGSTSSEFSDPGGGDSSQCFYRGSVGSNKLLVAVFSLCDGMWGMFNHDNNMYFIKPLHKQNQADLSSPQPHVVFKQTIAPLQNHSSSSCGYTEMVNDFLSSPPPKVDLFTASTTKSSKKEENFKHKRRKNKSMEIESQPKNASVYHSRHKRSESRDLHIEVMVAADYDMALYHGTDLEHYILTLMAMVTTVYKHPSIKNSISVVLVKVVILNSAQNQPKITANAAASLQEFCKWQYNNNDLNDSSPNHYDTAVLLTRKDICRAKQRCDTLGLAEMGTMCDFHRSCSIIEDNGLSSAYTIAHEIGHVFNLPHDDSKKCKPYQSVKNGYHVMAPTLDVNSNPWIWSDCSAALLTEFIDTDLAECLLDRPTRRKFRRRQTDTQLNYPGQLYNIDEQCEMEYGKGYRVCEYTPACKRLWCTEGDISRGCRTNHVPWADGTPCGYNKRCSKGECVEHRILIPIDGSWGMWEEYSACTRPCGGGVKVSKRECNNPVSQNGGRYCLGKRIKYKSCNSKECPPNHVDFRAQQCSTFDGKMRISGLPPYIRWVPKYSGIQIKDMCKLFCRAVAGSAYYLLDDRVIDGTKCSPQSSDMCINGRCRRAGCDNQLGSTMRKDRCGVCGGDNSSCRTIKGAYLHSKYGYNTVVKIPTGATNIEVSQRGYKNSIQDHTYLALVNSKNHYILNGNFTINTYRSHVKVKGGMLEYSGSNVVVERINSSLEIREDITVMVLSVGQVMPPNIEYSYSISVGRNVKFLWGTHGPWTDCSNICQGMRAKKIICVREEDDLIVSDQRCEGQHRPKQVTEPCNTHCTTSWQVLYKDECSVRCGHGIQHRRVHCLKSSSRDEEIVEDRFCLNAGQKMSEEVACVGQCLPTHWDYTAWSECSKSCGSGKQQRQARCVDANAKQLLDRECNLVEKVMSQTCNELPCSSWKTGDWTGCTVTCGSGKRMRGVRCHNGLNEVPDSHCNNRNRPVSQQVCSLQPCPTWFYGEWQLCSVTCSKGVRWRVVKCRTRPGELLDDSVCDAAMRPRDRQNCNRGSCPTSTHPVLTQNLTSIRDNHVTWQVGSWTECLQTCGEGKRHRHVGCVDTTGNRRNDRECINILKPFDVERCIVKFCGQWRHGQWSQCSVTCKKTRIVICTRQDVRIEEWECDLSMKPSVEKKCEQHECLHVTSINKNWRVGQWSGCSSTCGVGWQRRHVVCLTRRCSTLKPDEQRTCSSGLCPMWVVGEWNECSEPCGVRGYQKRIVLCQLPNGQTLSDSNCDVLRKPPEKGACISRSCTSWRLGPWSTCSVTCGRGLHHRKVACVGEDGNERLFRECAEKPPKSSKQCRMGRCPRWYRGAWSQCSVSCGSGIRVREVKCKEKKLKTVDPSLCKANRKPAGQAVCMSDKCGLYNWQKKKWSQCSKTCGFGVKTRRVVCVKELSGETPENFCDIKLKPKMQRRCAEIPCPYIWNTDAWTACSKTCGSGQQTRRVVCQAMTKEGWILPGEASGRCKYEEKPLPIKPCNYGECVSRYYWRVGPWAKCTNQCGISKIRRRVSCVDTEGRKHHRRFCRTKKKPPHKRTCYNGPCYARTCRELRNRQHITVDGTYRLLIHGKFIAIYCKNMKRRKMASEYLNLKLEENYSEIYDKRLRRASTCPNNGTRSNRCRCLREPFEESGYTSYEKIRIDIRNLKIDNNDPSFAVVHSGRYIPYGTAGDCYSSVHCPQGRFQINLSGTDFVVSENMQWTTSGNRSSHKIWRQQRGKIVQGLCGGHCGFCFPNPASGLQLEIQQ